MYILGISCFYHDSAACLIKDGEIIAAVQEERFTRKKHDDRFPFESVSWCVSSADIDPCEIQYVVFYEKPFLKFERLLETFLAFAPKGFNSFCKAFPVWVRDKLFQKKKLINYLGESLGTSVDWRERMLFSEHHLSHAASAFFPSPFEESVILTLDGVGEWATSSLSVGRGSEIEVLQELRFPHSLGLLYSAFTYYAGFKVNSGEYKLMGLAPFGEPKYVVLIKDNLLSIAEDGTFALDMSFFDFATGLTMTTEKFHKLFGGKPRKPESAISQREMDLASSIQVVTEEIILAMGKSAYKQTGMKNICLAGGVALNCVANGKLRESGIFDDLWIQPASGDAGGAVGAALAAWYIHLGRKRVISSHYKDGMKGSYLGPVYTDDMIKHELDQRGAVYKQLADRSEMLHFVAERIDSGDAVGWMQGPAEFGPRALGNRSILADPRSPIMQKALNLKIKFRESFRPFAPSVLEEHVNDWFDLDSDSPYMLLTANVSESKLLNSERSGHPDARCLDEIHGVRSSIPAVTHVDSSARVQTVSLTSNELFYQLISKFYQISSVPILINTSFNVRGEPIVNSPADAFNCFMGTGLDLLVIGNFVMLKSEQSTELLRDYKNMYELD